MRSAPTPISPPRALQPACGAHQEQRVGEPPRPQREHRLQHAHPRDEDESWPRTQRRDADGVGELAKTFLAIAPRRARSRTRRVPVQPRPRTRTGRDHLRSAAERVHAASGCPRAEPEHCLQRAVVAEVAAPAARRSRRVRGVARTHVRWPPGRRRGRRRVIGELGAGDPRPGLDRLAGAGAARSVIHATRWR